MGHVRWYCSGIVAAPADVVYAWLTDFTEDDHNSEAYRRGAGVKPKKGKPAAPAKRTVLSRDGNVLRIRDRWDGNDWTQTVTLDPSTHSYRVEGGFGYEAEWRAIPEGNATRVEFAGQLGKGIVGSLMRLFSGRMQKSMESDFQGHLEDLRETLRAAEVPGQAQERGAP